GSDEKGNIIAFNNGPGIEMIGASDAEIIKNSIHDNQGLGIDISARKSKPGVLLPLASAVRPLLFPLVDHNGDVTVAGALIGEPNQKYTVQFYSNDDPDPSGFGEGTDYIGKVDVTTNLVGFASFTFTTDDLPPDAHLISATATEVANGLLSTF